MYHKFASIQHPEKIAYSIDTSSSVYGGAGRPLAYWAHAFETYGDGLKQHSGSWLVQEENFIDYCYSLAAFMLSLPPQGELQSELRWRWPSKTSIEKMRFAQSVRYDEKRVRYYSMQEQKLSTSENKRYDRRWAEVPSWADGLPESMARLIQGDSYGAVLQTYSLYLDCYNYNLSTPGSPWSERPTRLLKLTGRDFEIEACHAVEGILVEAWFSFERAENELQNHRRRLDAVDAKAKPEPADADVSVSEQPQ